MRIKFILVFLISFIFCGCQALQEKTGEFVKDAVVEKVSSDIDSKLVKKGTSLKEIKGTIDDNGDGSISSAEAIAALKEYSKDFILLEAQKVIGQKIQEKELASKTDLDSHSKGMWSYLMTTLGTIVLGYLTKQIYSAKSDAKRDAKIAVLEKLLTKNA